MAVRNYVGKQIARPKILTLTVATADTAAAVTFTGGNSQVCAVIPSSTTVATAAADFAQALQNAGGVFNELSVSVNGAIVRIEGPANGLDFTFSKADGGSNSTTLATLQTKLSPHDVADVLNWSGGALPVDTVDSICLENGDVDMLDGLTALAALELAAPGFIRRKSHTGRIGLPTTNDLGFPEYRTTTLSVESPTYLIETNDSDTAGQFRILSTSAVAVAITITGDTTAGASPGEEVFEISGTPASSTADCVGGSLAVAPIVGQTGTIATLKGINSTIRVGAGATLSGTVDLVNCQARIMASWTTSLTMNGGETEVAGAAAGVLVIEGGTVFWRSTGVPGAAPIIGTDATLDLSLAPAAVTVSGTIQMYARSTLDNSSGRLASYAFKTVHCTISEVTIITQNDKTYTVS